MSILDDMTDEQRSLVVSLPYRIGVWIGESDDSEGNADDKKESKALERAIRDVAKRFHLSLFVQAVMEETLQSERQWPKWSENTLNVLDDCERILPVVKSLLSKGDYLAFRKYLYQIAAAVAEVHGEFGDDEAGSETFMDRLKSLLLHRQKQSDFINISSAEREALDSLKATLLEKKIAD